MANPTSVICTADQWVKVASGVLVGKIYQLKKGDYYQTYRVKDDPAPTTTDLMIPIFVNGICAKIDSGFQIDVYLYCRNENGEVRVDV